MENMGSPGVRVRDTAPTYPLSPLSCAAGKRTRVAYGAPLAQSLADPFSPAGCTDTPFP